MTEVLGDDNKVTGVKVVNNQTNEQSTIETSGVFIYVGLLPMTTAFEDLKITDADGWIRLMIRWKQLFPGFTQLVMSVKKTCGRLQLLLVKVALPANKRSSTLKSSVTRANQVFLNIN